MKFSSEVESRVAYKKFVCVLLVNWVNIAILSHFPGQM